MLLDIINAGLGVVEKVIKIAKEIWGEAEKSAADTQLERSIRAVEQRVVHVERAIQTVNLDLSDSQKLIAAYEALLDVLRETPEFSAYIKLVPTEYGTMKIVRRRRRTTILRDPEGEFNRDKAL